MGNKNKVFINFSYQWFAIIPFRKTFHLIYSGISMIDTSIEVSDGNLYNNFYGYIDSINMYGYDFKNDLLCVVKNSIPDSTPSQSISVSDDYSINELILDSVESYDLDVKSVDHVNFHFFSIDCFMDVRERFNFFEDQKIDTSHISVFRGIVPYPDYRQRDCGIIMIYKIIGHNQVKRLHHININKVLRDNDLIFRCSKNNHIFLTKLNTVVLLSLKMNGEIYSMNRFDFNSPELIPLLKGNDTISHVEKWFISSEVVSYFLYDSVNRRAVVFFVTEKGDSLKMETRYFVFQAVVTDEIVIDITHIGNLIVILTNRQLLLYTLSHNTFIESPKDNFVLKDVKNPVKISFYPGSLDTVLISFCDDGIYGYKPMTLSSVFRNSSSILNSLIDTYTNAFAIRSHKDMWRSRFYSRNASRDYTDDDMYNDAMGALD